MTVAGLLEGISAAFWDDIGTMQKLWRIWYLREQSEDAQLISTNAPPPSRMRLIRRLSVSSQS